MRKARQFFEEQQYLQCVNALVPRLEKREKMVPRDEFEHVFLYGVALLEYGIQYAEQYREYQNHRQEYEQMAAEGYAERVAIPEIKSPDDFINEALQALYAARELVCKHFPQEVHQKFAIGVHIIRARFLLHSSNISAEIDHFLQFLDECGDQRWQFERYAECLAEIATFCENSEQTYLINKELSWYWREEYCAEHSKKIWHLFYVNYGTSKVDSIEKQCEMYL